MGTNQRAQITMSDEEITAFVERSRTATMATNGPGGIPHLIAMWYGVIDGKVYFETKAKSQKAVNLRRDPNIAVMIEAGYDVRPAARHLDRGHGDADRGHRGSGILGGGGGACSSATPARTRTRPSRSSRS